MNDSGPVNLHKTNQLFSKASEDYIFDIDHHYRSSLQQYIAQHYYGLTLYASVGSK